jgi:predicted dehydrogenase
MIGYKFMGKAHSRAYRDLPFNFDMETVPVMRAIAGRDPDGTRAAAKKMGWAAYESQMDRWMA